MKSIALALLLSLSGLTWAQSEFKVEVIGKGNPVLFFPGIGCPGEVWIEAVAALSKTNECHVFTFAGFGNVSPVEGPWLEKMYNSVIQYVNNNKIKKATLVGHSLGGTLGLWLASTQPKLFKELIVVDALPATAAIMIPNYKGDKMTYDNPQSNMLLNMDSEAFQKFSKQTASYMSKNLEKQNVIAKWIHLSDRKTYVHAYVDMLNLDLRESIASIKIPTIVLAAANPSRQMVEKNYAEQYKKLPGVQIHYAENAAHFIMFDQPDWFIGKLKQFIN